MTYKSLLHVFIFLLSTCSAYGRSTRVSLKTTVTGGSTAVAVCAYRYLVEYCPFPPSTGSTAVAVCAYRYLVEYCPFPPSTGSTAVAVCVPIIILLIIVIVLMALYIWRNNKRTMKRYAMERYVVMTTSLSVNSVVMVANIIGIDLHAIYEIALESNSTAGNPRPSDDPNKNYRQNGVPKSGRRRRRRRPVDILTSIEEEASGEQIQEVDEEVLETEDFVCEENTEVNNETPHRPVIDSAGSSHDVISWDNNTIYLQCLVSGKPAPRITWFDPKGGEVKVGVMILPDRGVLAVMTQAPEDYGEYRCNVKNSHGFDNYYVQVTKLGLPGPPRLSITEKDIEARTITVRWTANPHANAPVDYRVEIGDKTPREGVRGNSVVISGLDKDTEYLVRVTARNQAGYGNSSQVTVRTKKEDPVVTVTSCSTAVAVCVPIIILLIIVIVLMALYIWRNNKRTKYILLSVKRYAMESVKDGEKKGTENIYEIALESNSSAGNPRPSDDPNKNYRQNGVPKSGRRRRRRRPVDILTSIEEEASGEQIQEVDEEVLETEDFVCEENTEVNNETPSVSVNENGGKTVVSVDVHDSAA
ncbi:predicted protein [Nematostella vectensis]|uniref:Uncharacterized protein n=1 Tax=Nematostella vectensis TaxID=45351 RepID=A7RYM5_NEMVE|nr:predicted protein [Nematostella vectensis]|eukprot:XP_001635551.1 predicted protein [Nematostella vectensis]